MILGIKNRKPGSEPEIFQRPDQIKTPGSRSETTNTISHFYIIAYVNQRL